ncbi:hypothetical protein Tco_0890095 [Tanacetum coccineum]
MIRLRAETPSTSHPLPQLTSSPHCSVQSSRPHDKTGPRLHYPPLKSIGWNTEMQLQRAEGSSSIGLESLMVCRPERGSVEEDKQTQIYHSEGQQQLELHIGQAAEGSLVGQFDELS